MLEAKNLWKRYALALSLIALVITSCFIVSEINTYHAEEGAIAINISGRQRMLSQRIALFSNAYIAEIRDAGVQANEFQSQLQQSRDLFKTSHNALINGDKTMHLSGKAGKIAYHLYFEEPHRLDQLVRDYIAHVDVILSAVPLPEKEEALIAINHMAKQHLLGLLNAVVKEIELYDRQQTQYYVLIERVSYALALFILLMEAIFIFWPTHRYIMQAWEDRERVREVEKEKEVAVEASQAKSEFLANMSHELRTPLNSILGMLQLMDRKQLSPEVNEKFDLINTSSQNLLEIVNDILDLSKIEANQVDLECKAFDVSGMVDQTVRALLPIAEEKGLQLNLEMAKTPVFVMGDSLRFGRIMTNLVGNALRYTIEGHVSVQVDYDHPAEGKTVICCTVQDSGIGIAEDKLETIFDKFSQADLSTTRRFGGTGLGLTITRELISLMQGEIGVESIEGEGSTFRFRVPFDSAEHSDDIAAQPVSKTPVSGLFPDAVPAASVRVLVAEDHKLNQVFVKQLFAKTGIETYRIVENGAEAVAAVRQESYDLVLMDCHMPEMNGYTATETIRTLTDPDKAAIPIIAMTANAMPDDERRCLQIGMNAYISKPVDIDLFVEKLTPWVTFDPERVDNA